MNNNELERDVLDELLWDDSIDASRINVHTDNTIVILTGFVSTYHERWNASDDARRVGGVTDVENDIIVDPASDRVLRRAGHILHRGLKANRMVPADAITVTANDGWITMKGNVQRQAAEPVVRHPRGLQGFTAWSPSHVIEPAKYRPISPRRWRVMLRSKPKRSPSPTPLAPSP